MHFVICSFQLARQLLSCQLQLIGLYIITKSCASEVMT